VQSKSIQSEVSPLNTVQDAAEERKLLIGCDSEQSVDAVTPEKLSVNVHHRINKGLRGGGGVPPVVSLSVCLPVCLCPGEQVASRPPAAV